MPSEHWFGLKPPRNAKLAWGARGLRQANGWAFYPDRQQWKKFKESLNDQKITMREVINTDVQTWLDENARTFMANAFKPYEYTVKGLYVCAEYRDGYLYLVVWKEKFVLPSMPKVLPATLSVVTVIERSYSEIEGLEAFPDTEGGRYAAKKMFQAKAKALGLVTKGLDPETLHTMQHYATEDHEVSIVYSN